MNHDMLGCIESKRFRQETPLVKLFLEEASLLKEEGIF